MRVRLGTSRSLILARPAGWAAGTVCLHAVLLAALIPAAPAHAEEIVVDFGSSMVWLRNASDPGIGTAWTGEMFDDSGWTPGQYGVGFETGSGAENLLLSVVPSPANSVYTRTTFNVTDIAQVQNLVLGCDFDDSYAAWINGIEVYRTPGLPPGPLAWNSSGNEHESSNAPAPVYDYVDISGVAIPALKNGANTLAIGVWNIGSTSTDLVLAPQLVINKDVVVTRGPYLQLGTPNSIVVRWRTDAPTDSRVFCGPSPGSLVLCGSRGTVTTEHEVDVDMLTADTQYYYAVGSSSQILVGDDANHFFVTAPPTGTSKPTRIWIIGDSGTGTASQLAVRDAYYGFTGATHTDLWLMLGDNAYSLGTQTEYQQKLFDVYPDMLIKSVLWPTIGNHDVSSAGEWPYFDIFTLPTAGEAGGVPSGNEHTYSFDYGNIHFVVLDSQNVNRNPGGAMLTWLEADLAATTADWIIAYWHHPPYSKGVHDSDLEAPLIQMRRNAVPILDAHGVDMTFTGHSHNYERSFLIQGHYDQSGTFGAAHQVDMGDGRVDGDGGYAKAVLGPDPYSGIVHSVAGNAGKITGGPLNHPVMYESLNVLGSVVLDIDGPLLQATFIDDTGTVRDYYTIVKGGSGIPPVADFQSDPVTGTSPLTVSFSDQSQNQPEQWAWDFDDDGDVDSTLANPDHEYDQPGVYSVRLTVTNLVGSDEMVRLDEICVHAGPPSSVFGVAFEPDGQTLIWQPVGASETYDVVRGGLAALRSAGGDFSAASPTCLENDVAAVSAVDAEPPGAGGFFYLVSATNCASQAGTYESGGPSQTGSRDLTLLGGGAPCP